MKLGKSIRFLLPVLLFLLPAVLQSMLYAQTAVSLFMKADSLQTNEIFSASGDEFGAVGHHGPAIENSHCALRIYFNDSGSIDVYSKSGRGMELRRYLWYPDEKHKAKFGAGDDVYKVGNTLGAGGVALWDDGKVVPLKATRGRRAKAGKTKSGAFIEMISYGVVYQDSEVDICVRVDMSDKNRTAIVTASELSGKKVQFVTGVNFYDGELTDVGRNHIAVWGKHPSDSADLSPAVGVGLKYREDKFLPAEKTDGFLRIVSKPTSRISTNLIAASEKEAELRSAQTFFNFVRK